MVLEIIGAVASIAGAVIGLPALIMALVQLRRTKKAAEAAAASANDALQRLSNVVAVASIEQICGRSRDLLHLMRARNLVASATAAFELREALAKFCKSKVAMKLLEAEAWSKLLTSAAEVHDALEGAASIKKIDARIREQLLQTVASLHAELSMLAPVAGEKAGEINVYSK